MSFAKLSEGKQEISRERRAERLDLSVVLPVYNERENLRPLHEELLCAIEPLGISYEILYVDDGSTDGSGDVLDEIQRGDPTTVVLHLRRNFGQTAALAAAFDHARGEVVVTMDADRQNDPADIPRLLDEMKEYDIVSGWRKDRKDTFWTRRLPSRLANRLISSITGVHLRDYGCTLKAYRREVVKNVELWGDLHRFVPAVASWMGTRMSEIEVNHRPRIRGQSKYSTSRIFRVLLDLLVVKFFLSYSASPIRFFGAVGMVSVLAGMAISLYLSVLKLSSGVDIGGRPLFVLGVLLIVVGLQLLMMGLLGELIARVYYGSMNKPIYVLREPPEDVQARRNRAKERMGSAVRE
ncbi:MAG: glycosyltransferase family 2 protein [Nitrospinota bacterium]